MRPAGLGCQRLRDQCYSQRVSYGGWKRIWPGMARSAGAGWLRIDSARRLARFLAEPNVLHSDLMRLPCKMSCEM